MHLRKLGYVGRAVTEAKRQSSPQTQVLQRVQHGVAAVIVGNQSLGTPRGCCGLER